jgi:hypothetical protein
VTRLDRGPGHQPVRIVAFNTVQGWSRDVSEEIARDIQETSERKGDALSPGLSEWINISSTWVAGVECMQMLEPMSTFDPTKHCFVYDGTNDCMIASRT